MVRDRDDLFDMMLHVCGWDYQGLTPTARGWVNKAVKELRDAGLDDPAQLLSRSRRYWRRYGRRPTPTAIVKHYAAMGPAEGAQRSNLRHEHLIEEASDPPYCVRCRSVVETPTLRVIEGGA